MFCWSSAYFVSEIEILSTMFTWGSSSSAGTSTSLTLLRVSARICFFSRKVLNFEVKPTHFEDRERNGATDIGFRSIVSSGRWSVCTSVAFPRMYSLNLCALNTIAKISFSMGTQLSSDLRSLRDT